MLIIKDTFTYTLDTNLKNFYSYMNSENLYKYICNNSDDIYKYEFNTLDNISTVKYELESPFPNFIKYIFKNNTYTVEDISTWDFKNNISTTINKSSFHDYLNSSFVSKYKYKAVGKNKINIEVEYIFTLKNVILLKSVIRRYYKQKMKETHNSRIQVIKKYIDSK